MTQARVVEHFLGHFPRKWFNAEDIDIVFVLGTGKCGSVTITKILNASPGVYANHELAPRLWHLNNEAHKDDCESNIWDAFYWATRRDYCSITQDNGLVFGEVNHRTTWFLPALKRLFPKAKFIILWREFNSCVESMVRWGVYSPEYRARQGALEPPESITDSRVACAWYWVTLHEYILKHIEGTNFTTLPFTWIKEGNTEAIANTFEKIGLDRPPDDQLKEILSEKLNPTKINLIVPKVWGEFDDRARAITTRLQDLEKC